MELYSREKASPFAGCLPVLAQTLFGVPLGAGLVGSVAAGTATWVTACVCFVLMVLIAVVAQASRKLLAPPTPEIPVAPASGAPASGVSGSGAPANMPDLSGMLKVLSFMPFMTAVIAAFVPLAAALYLATTTTWTLVERLVLMRVMGARPSPRGDT